MNFIQVMLTHVVFRHHCHFEKNLFIYFLNTNKRNLLSASYSCANSVLCYYSACLSFLTHTFTFYFTGEDWNRGHPVCLYKVSTWGFYRNVTRWPRGLVYLHALSFDVFYACVQASVFVNKHELDCMWFLSAHRTKITPCLNRKIISKSFSN